MGVGESHNYMYTYTCIRLNTNYRASYNLVILDYQEGTMQWDQPVCLHWGQPPIQYIQFSTYLHMLGNIFCMYAFVGVCVREWLMVGLSGGCKGKAARC